MDAQFNELRDLIVSMREHVDGRFNQMDGRLGQIDGRLDQMDGRLGQMDGRLDQIDGRLDQMDERFNQIDVRLDQMDERDRLLRDYIDERFTQMHDYVDERFTEMHDYVDERTRDMETRLLKGFDRWTSSMELTVKPMPIRMSAIEDRVAIMEERLRDFGKPPSQAS